MTVSFRAYVDESGDEGFRFCKSSNEKASSDWFVLAAFVTREKTDLDVVKVIDQVRREFDLHPRKHIHWKSLKHPQKVRYAQIIATLQARIIAVCVHKPSLLEPETFRQRYRLYFYAVRYLIERISWLARDRHNPSKWGGDGTVELIFSNRQGMSYDEMRQYLQLLEKQKQMGKHIQIDFDRIPVGILKTQTPGRSMGLQLADAVAGAFFNAIERDRFGNTEPRYLKTIQPVLYRYGSGCQGYGFKIVPREAITNLSNDENLKWLLGFK
jgi:hypothetical protein